MTKILLFIVFAVLLIHLPDAYAQAGKNLETKRANGAQNDSLTQLIHDYSQGFVTDNFNLIRNAIGSQLMMVNGNFSGDPIDWQAHQFLNEGEIGEWIVMMLKNAKPFENSIEIKNVNLRGHSAIVVTHERGKNKFRIWENEEVAYLLGKTNRNWKIVGIFIKNLKNPD